MSDRTLICLGVALAGLGLYVNLRVALALSQVKTDADKTLADVKASPAGQFLGFLGLK